MAFDAFLKIDGAAGEATQEGHANEIEIYSFSWGASNPTTITQGTGGGASKVSLSAFNVMKKTDSASTALFNRCCSGKHFPEAVVTLRKAGGDKPLEYLVYKFFEVYVESIQWSGASGGDDTPTESVSLAFSKCEVVYQQQDEKGGSKKTLGGGWDIRLGAPSGVK